MIQKAILIKGNLLEETRLAPYVGDVVFIVDDEYLILAEEIIEDFDIKYYREIFDVTQTVD